MFVQESEKESGFWLGMDEDYRQFFDAEESFESLSDCTDEFEDVLDTDAFERAMCVSDDQFLLHRLAFDGEIDQLERRLKECSEEERVRLDPQGNSILHLGVLRNNKRVLEVALESGISCKTANARGWNALDEAIAAKNKELVGFLYQCGLQEVKAEIKAAKAHLIQTLSEMPDYSMELNWQLGSPVIGYLLRKFAPHDTYKIYKMGSKIRIDGTLMGVDKSSGSLLPEWKRGDFSLLFDGSTSPALLYLVYHDTKEYLDLTEEKQERKKNGQFDFDIDMIVGEGAGRTKLRATDFRFKPVKGWLTNQLTEKIEKWNTRVYEASGKMIAVTRLKSSLVVPSNCTFEEYLQLKLREDKVVETAVNPPGLSGKSRPVSSEDTAQESKKEGKAKPKKLSGRCWMAEDFPMSLRQLLPLLDVVGQANKHIGRVSKFMRKYGDMNMFPVRIQVPLLLTVYLLVSFKKFKFTTCSDGWCDLPKGYSRVKLEEVLQNSSLAAMHNIRSPNSTTSVNPDAPSFSQLTRDPIEY